MGRERIGCSRVSPPAAPPDQVVNPLGTPLPYPTSEMAMRRVGWLLLVIPLTLAACRPTTAHKVPLPNVHVSVELTPDSWGNCCLVTTTNPTPGAVNVHCTVTAYRPNGDVAFRGTLSGPLSGWTAPPGRHTSGEAGVSSPDDGALKWHPRWRLASRCDAYVWHGQPPIYDPNGL